MTEKEGGSKLFCSFCQFYIEKKKRTVFCHSLWFSPWLRHLSMGVNGMLLSAPCPTLPRPSPRGRALCSYFIRRSCDLILLTTSDQQAVRVAPSTGWSVGIRSLADCCVRISFFCMHSQCFVLLWLLCSFL